MLCVFTVISTVDKTLERGEKITLLEDKAEKMTSQVGVALSLLTMFAL
jgi:hypothetical protein